MDRVVVVTKDKQATCYSASHSGCNQFIVTHTHQFHLLSETVGMQQLILVLLEH